MVEMKKRRLRLYLEAEAAILRGQAYTIGDRQLTRANLSEVRKQIDILEAEISATEKGRGNCKRAVFID